MRPANQSCQVDAPWLVQHSSWCEGCLQFSSAGVTAREANLTPEQRSGVPESCETVAAHANPPSKTLFGCLKFRLALQLLAEYPGLSTDNE